MNKHYNNLVGASGEEIANKYLKNNGYRIVKTNYKNKIGEVDIIAYDNKTLVFVEVKYRKNDYFGLPREAVNYRKQMKIRQVATIFINQNRLFDKEIRFDVVEILDDKITLIKNCF
ncbi:MAG: YraN family protein [Christensenellales bacterium]